MCMEETRYIANDGSRYGVFSKKMMKRGNVPGPGRGRKSKSLIFGLQAYFNLSVWGLQWERDLKTFSQLKKMLRS